MADIYKDPIMKKYQELIEAAMPGVFKFVYYGDPIRIPKSSLPALIMAKSQTRVGNITDKEDEHGMAILLTVVTDVRDTVTDDTEMVAGVNQLYDIIEGRDAATYMLKSATILNVLRSNVLVDSALNLRTDLGTITQVDYGLTIGKRTQEGYAVEGTVQFIAHFTQIRQ